MINSILQPPSKRISFTPTELNDFFSTIAKKTVPQHATPSATISERINKYNENECDFKLQPVSYSDVFALLKNIKTDCSTGADNIPFRFVKPIIEYICSPLTHIINSHIAANSFPRSWKIARVVPINKNDQPMNVSDYRPISILPALSKIFERIVLKQLVSYIEQHNLYKSTVNGFRKHYSTGSALVKLRDDILQAMRSGEVTLMVLIDYSKAFDTIHYDTLISKLQKLGMSTSFLHWVLSYVSDRNQFVHIDSRSSATSDIEFGVPQGSILGPILFNLYVNDLSEQIASKTVQYADDTSVYERCRPSDIAATENKLNDDLHKISEWSRKNSLAANALKTKYIMYSTSALLRHHNINNHSSTIKMDGKDITVTDENKILGVHFDKNLSWCHHISDIIASCYATIRTLRKLQNFTNFKLRKQLSEALILSKIDYCDYVYKLNSVQTKKLQRVQLVACSFVLQRYATMSDVLKLKWLPIKQRRAFHIAKLVYKSINGLQTAEPLQVKLKENRRVLRNNNRVTADFPDCPGTFQDQACKSFNTLPINVRESLTLRQFCSEAKTHLLSQAVTEHTTYVN